MSNDQNLKSRYVNFFNAVKSLCEQGKEFSFGSISKIFGVNAYASGLMRDCKIVESVGRSKYNWIYTGSISEAVDLYLLRQRNYHNEMKEKRIAETREKVVETTLQPTLFVPQTDQQKQIDEMHTMIRDLHNSFFGKKN